MAARTIKTVTPTPVSRENVRLRGVVYADPKVGKTSLGLTYPRPLIINTDFGLEGDALDLLDASGGIELRADTEGWGYKDLEGLVVWCREHQDDYDSIIFDSGDRLARILLTEITAEGKGARGGSSSGALGQSFFDFVPEQAEHLASQTQLDLILTEFRKLNKHMLVTFGVREGAGTQGRASFNTSPGLQEMVKHWSNFYGRLLIAPSDSQAGTPDPYTQGQRVLLLDPGSKSSMAGTRFRALYPHVTNPTFDKLWGLVASQTNDNS